MVVDRDEVDEEGRAADDHRQEERGEEHLTDPRFPVHPAMVEYFNLRTDEKLKSLGSIGETDIIET